MSIQPTSLPTVGCEGMNASMQLSHGTLVHDGRSLDGQEYQRGDPVTIIDNGSNEDLKDSIHVLNLRNNQYMLVLLKSVCWIPTHTEQRSGATFLLTLYGSSLEYRHTAEPQPRLGNRGIATLLGSSVYVAREVVLEGNPSRAVLDAADRVSTFTVQWDALSVDAIQQPALTPTSSSCASSRCPSESGDDVPVMHFYRHQGRRDSAIEIRDPESPIYKSTTHMTSPKPPLKRSAFFATKYNTRFPTEVSAHRQYPRGSATWSDDVGSDDEASFDVDAGFNHTAGCPNLGLCHEGLQLSEMNPDSDLQVNFVFMPQNDGENYAAGHQEQQRPDNNPQNTMWAPSGLPAHEQGWNQLQMPPQQVQEMRQPQMPTPQRQQQHQPPPRQEVQPEYYDQYRLMDRSQAQALSHHPQQIATSNMHNQRGEYAPTQHLPQGVTSHPVQSFQMQPRYSEQSNRLPVHGTAPSPFPVPEEVHIVQSNRHEPRPPYSLPSSTYSPVHEGSLPSTSHTQQPRRSPMPDESRSSSARGTPVMARRAKPQPTHTFTPTAMVNSFRQITQSHLASLERHFEQLQQGHGNDEQIRKAEETLQAARRAAESSSQTLGLLQPLTGIPFRGTESRLQSLSDQIAAAMQNLLPGAAEQPASPEEGVQQLNKKVQDLKEFIEYLEGVHPEAVRRAQASAEASSTSGDKPRQDSKNLPVSTSNRVPSAPASVSSQMGASDDDSCRWVDGQATPPPDRSAAMGQNRDQSRMFRDMANGHGRIRQENRITSDFYPNAAYSRPSSLMNSPVTSHPAPAEPNHGFFQQALPVPVQQSIPLSDYAMQSRPIQAYTPPTSAEMMRPMQAISSLPSQHYTTQQENPFCLRPSQQACMYPTSGAEMPQSGYAPRSPVSFQPTGPNPPAGYYQDMRSSLPDRRPMRQERQAPYSLSYRDQRRRRGSQ
ncbi:hypothetical protein CkaCkLH20_02914 [Colletotrichum karsti]|uniref:Uncharacterized protein n=1 Tax=Colletotrichum karsti TaxID=1095194 RepID=A0A9P6ICL8_9PEZI|nr:uncharacterized protein CkaCkLH20_02914 [Colletotrichum karsti]KAF9879371.1 hypothetical protein CkaCkLH20_02914 [Colletotrichum karsti]